MEDALAKRVGSLNDRPPGGGDCIVYWLQSSMRAQDNPALEFSIRRANALGLPLVVLYSIDRSMPSGNERNFTFMLEGLKELSRSATDIGATLCVRVGGAVENVVDACHETKAAALVTDESHLMEGRRRRLAAARQLNIPAYQVDANVVVPVREIRGEQYAAYTIRPRLMRLLDTYLKPAKAPVLNSRRPVEAEGDIGRIDVQGILKRLGLPAVKPSPLYHGGESSALRRLGEFVDKKLDGYSDLRNRPELDATSNLSPYLRFGQLSPVRMLSEVTRRGNSRDVDAFVNEALVWRELAENFTFYAPYYMSVEGLPDWARSTLEKHRSDKRESIFTLRELENGETGDEMWDAAQHEMATYGKMAGYMRMYWGKRVLEWTRTPEEALKLLVYLNDKYELDGRSPNGYAGVMWCFGKHDRAFGERPVYGKVRYMSPAGVRKKFSVTGYFNKIGYGGDMRVYSGSKS